MGLETGNITEDLASVISIGSTDILNSKELKATFTYIYQRTSRALPF